MVTRAQLAQGRSRQRRDELLAATIELFAEGGSRAVTHRAVARRAGLPPATTTYYFASIEELLREALAAHIQQWTTDLARLTDLDLGPTIGLDDATDLVSHVFAQRGPEVAGAPAVDLPRRDPRPGPARRRHRGAPPVRAARGARAVPARRRGAEPLAASIIAIVAGTALRRQSGQYTEQEEAR